MAGPWYAHEFPTFYPAMRPVDSITRTDPVVISTSFDHNYVTGTIVRIYVSKEYGMPQIDKLFGAITVTSSDTFTMPIDATLFQEFVIPVPIPDKTNSYPHVVPIGEINSILTAAVQNVLPY